MQHLVEPLVVSWGWQPEKTTLLALDGSDHPPSPFILQQEWQGTRDIAAYLSVPAAIQFQAEHDWPQVRQDCHELLRYACQAIGELTGLEPICPDSPEWPKGQMATIPLPPCDAEELKRPLYDEYRVEVPIITCGGRQFALWGRCRRRAITRGRMVLEAFVEPYLGLASTDNGQRMLLHTGCPDFKDRRKRNFKTCSRT